MARRDRALAGGLAGVVVVAVVALSIVLASPATEAGDETRVVSAMVAGGVAAPVSSSTLPTPAPPPSDPRAPTPIVEVGSIAIPAIGLDATMREGVTLTIIDLGPSHWPGSAMPGERGNVVVAGHRTIRSRPFIDLDRLAAGDEIVFRTSAGTFTYRVTRTFVVEPRDLWIIDPTPESTVTLFACHPKGSARQRIVVKGELVQASAQ